MVTTIAPRPPAPWPAPAGPARAVLDIRTFDLHDARALARRLQAAGVAPSALDVRGVRVEDGLAEADVKRRSRLHPRWRKNIMLAVVAAVVAGAPTGASVAMVLFAERPAAAALGALMASGGLAWILARAVWREHFQRSPESRPDSRVEGRLVVHGDPAVTLAEQMATGLDVVLAMRRRPPGALHGAQRG